MHMAMRLLSYWDLTIMMECHLKPNLFQMTHCQKASVLYLE